MGVLVHHGANLLPEELDRLALQRQHEPEHNTDGTSDANDSPYNEFMDLGNRQAEKSECNGYLC